ncbi:MAG: Phosphoenolpyruvate synthase [Microgenomates group bacterium GW2011_GWA1_48_10]|uniref:Phosphoenolpyruvate synthase n=1 Tax=Candidatus Gottesmanbacteria bacterium RIFCSPHIGHO2_01_FULL_47_48 TaxID=1798381 RepID=A0A1F5ZZE7_9BACT|nr:MAG: Phosphoenolpyruvate synthase [Microgenomates group bacterium GW2011_GWA1_48_10]OGG17724.1 MAG: hypothetical protein A2721_00585 [Candidatus Gottesmanbacteria bacterium RIFCSPHIGHO2_01_FULL_47_48]
MNSYILPITQITKDDAALVGAKAANLGEMHHLGLPIPPAFALTTQCFSDFLTFNRLSEQLRLLLSQTSPQNPEHLSATHRLIEHLFITAPFPGPLQTMLPSAYKSLSSAPLPSLFKNSPPLLAVRSSAVGEDSRVNSFAGQNETFLGVRGEVDLALAIKKCWASAFSPRSLTYRRSFGLDPEKVQIGVVVQTLINSDVSGVVFSINPVTGDQETIVIEAVFGLGELLVSGQVTPDHYEVSQKTRRLTLEQVAVQEKHLTINNGQLTTQPLDKIRQTMRKLNADQIEKVVTAAIKLQDHYYFPQDSEFAFLGSKIYLLQTRPITTIHKPEKPAASIPASSMVLPTTKPFLQGKALAPGLQTGHAVIIHQSAETSKITPGQIVIAPSFFPELTGYLTKMKGLVLETSPSLPQIKDLHRPPFPIITSVPKATEKIKTNQAITVDGQTGRVTIN